MRFSCRRFASGVARAPTPFEVFSDFQLGFEPPLAAQRLCLQQYYLPTLESLGVHEAKLQALDGKAVTALLRQAVYRQVLQQHLGSRTEEDGAQQVGSSSMSSSASGKSIRIFAFDLEFTEAPRFTANGPTAEIIEIGVYCPTRDERFQCLVMPTAGVESLPPSTTELTGITREMLTREGVPFAEAWERTRLFMGLGESRSLPPPKTETDGIEDSANVTNEADSDGGDGGEDDRKMVLLVSHGGRLADVSMLQWAWKATGIRAPSGVVFGDTFHLVRDAHRRRPVTPDRHPPSWKLSDLAAWLNVGGFGSSAEADNPNHETLSAHRAGDDARLTWLVLHHTLDRYGDDTLSTQEQLALRFFEKEIRQTLLETGNTATNSSGGGANHSDSFIAENGLEDDVSSTIADLNLDDVLGGGSGGATSSASKRRSKTASSTSQHDEDGEGSMGGGRAAGTGKTRGRKKGTSPARSHRLLKRTGEGGHSSSDADTLRAMQLQMSLSGQKSTSIPDI